MIDIDRLKALHEAAASAPWTQTWHDPVIDAPGRQWFITDEGGHDTDDAALICLLRNSVPTIIDMADRLTRYEARFRNIDEKLTDAECIDFCRQALGDNQ